MRTLLNKKQLAFLLSINPEDARAKMCVAYAKYLNHPIKAEWVERKEGSESKKIRDDYPEFVEIDVLSRGLNLPHLQAIVDDVENNYLIRPATKKYLLFDLPEKQIREMDSAGQIKKLSILPVGLRSLLSDDTIKMVHKEWAIRFPKYA